MKFLVSNDDGIQSEGILQLAASLMPFGEVVVAERNGSRHYHVPSSPGEKG